MVYTFEGNLYPKTELLFLKNLAFYSLVFSKALRHEKAS